MKMMPNTIKVLLIDDCTGRAHAVADLFVRTNENTAVYFGIGNEFITHPRIHKVDGINLFDATSIIDAFHKIQADFVFVAYADSMAAGVADRIRDQGIPCIGPSASGASLEASKHVTKKFSVRHDLPTPDFWQFSDPNEAISFCKRSKQGWVVKVDGFTSKSDGAIVCSSMAETLEAIHEAEKICNRDMLDFNILLEERISGFEVSAFAFVNDGQFVTFPSALDYKRTYDGDKGKNCDGMGTICPHPTLSKKDQVQFIQPIFEKTVKGLKTEGWHYSGFLYLGIMMTDSGPKLLEINVRFGDSEAEAVLPSIHEDFSSLCIKALRKQDLPSTVASDALTRCSVALTQGCLHEDDYEFPGWPIGNAKYGQIVRGIETFPESNARLFLAKVKADLNGLPVTDGGRVAHIVGVGENLEKATQAAYQHIDLIDFAGKRYRKDIGQIPASKPHVEPIQKDVNSMVSFTTA